MRLQPLTGFTGCYDMDYSHNVGSLATSALESTNNPPSSNRGVVNAPPAFFASPKHPKGAPVLAVDPLDVLKDSFFDWYQCSVPDHVDDVVRVIQTVYLGDMILGDWVDNARQPPYLYSKSLMVREGEDTVKALEIHWGGVNGGTFIRATSDQARSFASFVRGTWPDHSVSRADIAIDFNEAGAFESLHTLGVTIAKEFGLKIRRAGDWDLNQDGRTLYIGSRQSVLMIRIYEKGIERQKAGVVSAPSTWVRFELEVKPAKSDGKRKAATMEPYEFFGASKACRYVAEVLSGRDLNPVRLHTQNRPAEFMRSINHMAYQYHDVLERFMTEVCEGDAVKFASRLMEIAFEQRENKKMIRRQISDHAKYTRILKEQHEKREAIRSFLSILQQLSELRSR